MADDPETPTPWRAELAVVPLSIQVNGPWVRHHGSGARVAVAVSNHFRVLGSFTHHWSAGASPLATSVQETLTADLVSPTQLLTPTQLLVGTEAVLGRGATNLRFLHTFEFSVQGLVGATTSAVELKPSSRLASGAVSPATVGDTGLRFAAGVGVGARFEFLERFSLRADIRSVFAPGRVQQVNGCSLGDLAALDALAREREPSSGPAPVSATCDTSRFEGVDAVTGARRGNDVPLALGLLRSPGVEWVPLISAQLALGVVF